jgi:uncharacterized membrane protein (DUF106 family)
MLEFSNAWKGKFHHQVQLRSRTMKYINYGFIFGSIILFFMGLYYWLAKSQIDYAAFYFALAGVGEGAYLLATKADKAK